MTTRTEYVVYIPDSSGPNGRREVTRYPDREHGEDPGAQRAAEHVADLHLLATRRVQHIGRRLGEAFAVEQIITVEETPLELIDAPDA